MSIRIYYFSKYWVFKEMIFLEHSRSGLEIYRN